MTRARQQLPWQQATGGRSFGRVLVAADGSDGSRPRIQWTAALAAATRSEVLAVHVLTYNRELLRDLTPDTMQASRLQLQRDLQREWPQPLAHVGARIRCLVVEADSPAAGVLATADREQVHLVVVGAHGHGGLAGRVLSGVSYRVSHQARQPVVVVPPDWSR